MLFLIHCDQCEVEAGIQTSCAACNALHRARSKKTEHWMPCIQPSFKLNTMVTYRAGNLRLTSRFDHTRMVDVPRARNLPFAQAPVFATIRMTQQYLCVQPMTLRVHYFDPLDTDKLHREYVNRGVPGVQRLPPVSLCDIVETSMEFMRYVRAGALDGITLAAQKPDSNPTIRHIFSIIPQHLNMLEDQEEKNFLTGVIQHWFAAMHGLGSATLCPGPEGNALNIIPINDYMPKFGLISVPRMIVAQFDSIRFATMFKGAQHQILDRLQSKLLFNGKPQWFTVFLATFLILNIVSCSSRDRYRYVRENSQGHRLETRYGELNDPGTKNVEDLHQSAALLLAHWNYFRRADFGGKMRGKGIASMEQHERQIIERLKTEVENQAGQIEKNPVTGFWESDLGWVSCMFAPPGTAGNSWLPPPIFDRAKPSVGRMDEIPLDQRPMPVGWL
ncbi:hypothetical protein QBC38DRAFT_366546 [Podospora fimiseda]|uniref:Uncharacterized protein n=1 Tax=Podospora fimiseda TaxID=252190 RepID=A0AAN7BN41_9PEZI|nr:hypothetical protein QBC38DRAFT_366546 [Podospora fimiseda]